MTLGDKLLEILSNRGDMPISGNSGIAACLDSLRHAPDKKVDFDYSHEFERWLDTLAETGFVRRVMSGNESRLQVEASVLTMLPTKDANKALYIGARTAEFLTQAKTIAQELQIQVVEENTGEFNPSKICFQGELQNLAQLAKSLNARWFHIPLAYLLAKSVLGDFNAETLHDSLVYFDYEWFNPATLRYDGKQPTDQRPLGLRRYRLYNATHYDVYLWCLGQNSFRATKAKDPRALKWRLAGQSGIRLAYSSKNERIAIPFYCPLPLDLARALALCSGKPGSIRDYEGNMASSLGFNQQQVTKFLVFENVHPIVVDQISKRTGCEKLETLL